jgi:fatty-acyl-CoA synthase
MIGKFLREIALRRLHAPRDAARWAFRRHGERIALRTPEGQEVSFSELGRRVYALAAGLLESGLKPGDRVAFTLPNCTEFVELRLACHEAGLVAVPLIWDLSPQARAAALRTAGARLYVFDPVLDPEPRAGGARTIPLPSGDRSGLESLALPGAGPCDARVDLDSPATINFTSGTTGEPKGVVSTHRAWAASVKMTVRSSLLSLGRNEVFLHAIPLATAGWGAVLPCLLGGITGLLLREWHPARALGLLEEERVSRAFLTPSMLIDLLDEPDLEERDLSSLRAVIYGTAPLHGAKAAEALKRLGPVLHQGYGLAEVLPPLALLAPAEHDPADASLRVGRPAGGVSVRIVDAGGRPLPDGEHGRVEVKSPTQTPGYWNRPELNAEALRDGFFRTGDVGFVDAEGYLNVLGRGAEMLAGVAEHPRVVEEAGHEHPGVKECALVEVDGQPVLACSARRGRRLDAADVERTLAGSLPPDSRPARAAVTQGDLPRSAAGKIVRRDLGR